MKIKHVVILVESDNSFSKVNSRLEEEINKFVKCGYVLKDPINYLTSHDRFFLSATMVKYEEKIDKKLI